MGRAPCVCPFVTGTHVHFATPWHGNMNPAPVVPRGSLRRCTVVRTVCSAAKQASTHIRTPGSIARSPTHLVRFRRSRFVAHLTELHLRNVPGAPEPDSPSLMDRALASAGNAHEARVLQRYISAISRTERIRETDVSVTIPRGHPKRLELTAEALRSGYPIIHQAALTDGGLLEGYADLLVKNSCNPFVDRFSPEFSVGEDGYSVVEVKLASLARVDYVLQAATYTEALRLLSNSLGLAPPQSAFLWLGRSVETPTQLASGDIQFFYKSTAESFETFLRTFSPSLPIPDVDAPVKDLAPFSGFAKRHLENTDSLLQVAGIRRSQVRSLQRIGVKTMGELAARQDVQNMSREALLDVMVLKGLQVQAALQVQSRLQAPPHAIGNQIRASASRIPFQLVESPSGMSSGLHRLPPQCENDVYFDMEGYPLFQNGLEYLFGALENEGSTSFSSWWAHSREEEEAAFSSFVRWLWRRCSGLPEGEDIQEEQIRGGLSSATDHAMHVYHYGHYEVTALKRLAARAITVDGVRAGQMLEEMIASDVFVDIYKVVKTGLKIGEPSYSIKSVEKLVGISRVDDELADAESSVALYHMWTLSGGHDPGEDVKTEPTRLQSSRLDGFRFQALEDPDTILQNIEKYNRQDCESLRSVVEWLRCLRKENCLEYRPILRVDRGPGSSDESDNSSETTGEKLARGACGSTPERKLQDSAVIKQSDLAVCALLRMNEKDACNLDKSMVKSSREALAHILHFHGRESAPSRARFSDRLDCIAMGDYPSLYTDDKCLSEVHFVTEPGNVDRSPESNKREKVPRVLGLYRKNANEPCRLEAGSTCAFVSVDAEAGGANVHCFPQVRSMESTEVLLDFGPQREPVDTRPPKYGSLVDSSELTICPASMRQSLLSTYLDFSDQLTALGAGRTPVPEGLAVCESAYNDKFVNATSRGWTLPLTFLQRRTYAEILGLVQPDELVDRRNIRAIVAKLKNCTLVIQGPPGTGKSSLSADLISHLVCELGKTVAVSSNSHAAIDNLLSYAVKKGVPSESVCKVGKRSEALQMLGVTQKAMSSVQIGPLPWRQSTDKNRPVVSGSSAKRKSRTFCIVGGTSYALSNAEVRGKFDYLFVDEASQVPVASFVAMAACAKSAVLVGDQQQLEMPIEGSHPELVHVSCLSYFVGQDVAIVSRKVGLFLDRSYRMAPRLCSFVSETWYKNALTSFEGANNHAVMLQPGDTKAEDRLLLGREALSGILFVPREKASSCVQIETAGQQSKRHCPSEVAIVRQLVWELCAPSASKEGVGAAFAQYTAKGLTKHVSLADILVVAPYNAQVRALRLALPGDARVGTIDKFQGQESPIVIVSTCALSEVEFEDEDASPFDLRSEEVSNERADTFGTAFALNHNRMNVALSRAQCVAIVIGPRDISSNTKCKSIEEARVLSLYASIVDKFMAGGSREDE